MKKAILFLSAITSLWAPSGWGQGTLVYDQQSSSDESLMAGIGGANMRNVQSAQSFTPALSSIGFVRFKMADVSWGNDRGATVLVNLRGDAVSGPILSSTDAVTMADGFNGVVHFLFPSQVPLTPGTTYYLEPILGGGSDDWRLEIQEYAYPGGNPFRNGVAAGGDIWFREGIVAVPEPTSLLLTAAGLAAAVAGRWRGRRGGKA